jgi:hypothetical protein
MFCSACRKPIRFGDTHWVCSVSTCNRDRTRLVFCSVACWDSHLSTLRHREAWAVEAQAPSRAEAARERRDDPAPRPPAPAPRPPAPAPRPSMPAARPAAPAAPAPRPAGGSVTAHAGGPALSNHFDHDDVLVVVSKVKKYIRDRGGMNTSDAIAEALGAHVRKVCDDAIRNAVRDGRKTVLDRDVPPAFVR